VTKRDELHKGLSVFRCEHASSVDPETFALGAAFECQGLLGHEVRPRISLALCSNSQSHTIGRDFDGSTSHSHCRSIG
jgi:hypothetical protein